MSPTKPSVRTRGKRPDIELELTETYHVEYVYLAQWSTDDFDFDRSLANQARFVPLNEETVALYQEGVERGDAFPAVIASRQGRGANAKLVIIDGNHRLVAHQRAGAKIDVYEVDRSTKPATISRMTFGFNTKHGVPTTEEERLFQALFLVGNGASDEQAAEAVNVPLARLKRARIKQKADDRAKEVQANLQEWDKLAAAGRSRLVNIKTDEGFHDAIHLAYAARLNAEEMFELTSLLNTSQSARKQRDLVKSETARYQERIQDAAGGVLGTNDKRPMTPKARVGMLLGGIMSLPDDFDAVVRHYSDSERAPAASRLVDASERLRKLARVLDPTLK